MAEIADMYIALKKTNHTMPIEPSLELEKQVLEHSGRKKKWSGFVKQM